jgi:hypothetical protein
MLLNQSKRWVLSPLESIPSPMVDDWQNEATANGCTPDQIAQVGEMANEFYPPYSLPIVRQYCHRFDAPFHADTMALVYCEMDITHLAAAQKDPRLTIFNSTSDAVDPDAAAAYLQMITPAPAEKLTAVTSVTSAAALPATLGDLLAELEPLHIKFSFTE